MVDNYVNSIQPVALYVFDGGQRVSADSTPTVTATDISTGDSVAVSSVSVVSEQSYDYYTVHLSASETTTKRQVQLEWDYIHDGEAFKRIDTVNVVRPYFRVEDFWSVFAEYAPDGADSLTVDQVRRVEQNVRMRINRFCNQRFQDYGRKTIRHRGSGTDALQLTKRLYNLQDVRSSGLVLFERDQADEITTDLVEWNEEQPYVVTKKYRGIAGHDVYEQDKTIQGLHRNPLFRQGRYYDVKADYGWQYLPSDITQAALALAQDYVEHSDEYRRKNVTVLRSADYRMEFGESHHGTTGNVDVDLALGDYVFSGMVVF